MKVSSLTISEKQRRKEGDLMNTTSTHPNGIRSITGIVLGIMLSSILMLSADAQWYFDIGPVYRGDMEVSVEGGSRAAGSGLHAGRAGSRGQTPSMQNAPFGDDGTAQILRTFDDGYVGPSGWPWARDAGLTQFLGYNSPAQYDAGADTLTYHLTMPASATSARRTQTGLNLGPVGWSDDQRVDGVGLMGTIGYMMRQEESWSWALQTRLGWLDDIQARFHNRKAYSETSERRVYESSLVQQDTYAYTYDTLGNPAFPGAPYEMTDPSGVGPMIADTPEAITLASQTVEASDRLVSRSRSSAISLVDLNVDAEAFILQLGSRLQWNPSSGIALFVQAAATLNLLDASLRRHETFSQGNGTVIASWEDREDKWACRGGIGAQLGLQVAVTEHWRVSAAGGYDWVDKYRLSVGPDRVSIDLSGYEVELAVGRSF